MGTHGLVLQTRFGIRNGAVDERHWDLPQRHEGTKKKVGLGGPLISLFVPSCLRGQNRKERYSNAVRDSATRPCGKLP
jgi:hypothetical protein